MKLYLAVPGAKPIGDLYAVIGYLGFDGVRIDLPDEHQAATEVLRELADRPSARAIVLIAGGQMTRNHPHEGGPAWKPGELVAHVNDTMVKMQDLGLFDRQELPAIEIGNEPDLAVDEWKKKPEELARTFRRCYDLIRKFSPQAPVLCPSVSNLNERGFNYLERMVKEGLPLGCEIAVHRYPNGPNFEIPHQGFRNRQEEVDKLLKLAGGRPIWITEVGMREGPHGKDDLYLSEEDVADAFEWEMARWASVSQVVGICWYALNDGPDRKNEYHTYGVRRIDDSWKPVAERVRRVKEALA